MSATQKGENKNSLNKDVRESQDSVGNAADDRQYPVENNEYDKQSLHSKNSDSRSQGGKSKRSTGNSISSDSSVTSANGKQIADTLVRKFMFMYASFIAFAMHVFYLTAILLMNQGWILPFNAEEFYNIGPIFFEIWAMLCHAVTEIAFNDSLAAFLGYLMSQPDGYSIAACGFVHADFLGKIKFPNLLSFRSTAKPFLSKMSILWLVHTLMLFVGIIAATAIYGEKSRINSGVLMCLQYSQNYKYPVDRGIPGIEQEMGVAELIDGTALGYMRASDPTLQHSRHLLPPQLTDACQDGSTIIGHGFSTDIHTNCLCTVSSSESDLSIAGVESDDVTQVAEHALNMASTPGWINSMKLGKDYINITTVLTGINICGGSNHTSPAVAVCKTQLKNHTSLGVIVSYKTDGTPASIAAKTVDPAPLEGVTEEPANITWLYMGLNFLLGSNISTTVLPPHWPGSANPMLWLLSENMQDTSLGLLEPGMESSVALMIRAAMQRSYTVTGGFCTQNMINPLTVTVFISDYGSNMAFVWITFQFLLNIFAFVLYIPWLLSPNPILPAVQAAQDPIIFSLLSSKNAITSSRMKAMSSNIEDNMMWPKLDIVLRVGESILTAEDPERGVLLMDKPKLVTEMSYDKTYV